jgi:hypothetical protein
MSSDLPCDDAYSGPTGIAHEHGGDGNLDPLADGLDRDFLSTALADRTLASDIEAATQNPANLLFQGFEEKIRGPLNAAYPVYLHLVHGGAKAVEAVINHPKFVGRKRIHRAKRAGIALQLVSQPQSKKQFDIVSEYSPMLIRAGLEGIRPTEFADAMTDVTLQSCKDLIRSRKNPARTTKRTGNKPTTGDSTIAVTAETALAAAASANTNVGSVDTAAMTAAAARPAPVAPAIKITVTGAGQERDVLIRLTPAQAKTAAAVIDRASSKTAGVLRAIADLLQPKRPRPTRPSARSSSVPTETVRRATR